MLCECEFSLKNKNNTKNELLRTCFSWALAADKGTNIVQNICLTEEPFWAKLPLSVCGTFLSSKLACIWFLILHARIQYLKESQLVATEYFSIKIKETIMHKFSKKVFLKY